MDYSVNDVTTTQESRGVVVRVSDHQHKGSWFDPRSGEKISGTDFQLSLDTICEYGLEKR